MQKTEAQQPGSSAAPSGCPSEDTRLLDWLENLIRNCPHATFDFNDDPDAEDIDGDMVTGFTIRVEGCELTKVVGHSLRAAILAAIERDNAEVSDRRAQPSTTEDANGGSLR